MNASDQFGLSCALALPIDSDLTIDHSRLLAHARWCLDAGCSSLTIFGTTGEGDVTIVHIDTRKAPRQRLDL